MELKEMYRELREKKGYDVKKIASDLDINLLTFKSYLYKGTKPRDTKVLRKIERYFQKELASLPAKPLRKVKALPVKRTVLSEIKLSELSGIRKGLTELLLEAGKGDLRKAIREIRTELHIPNSSFNNWFYQGKIPNEENLKKLATYFTEKLKRKITPECILGKEIKEEPRKEEVKEEKLVEVKIADIIARLSSLVSELKMFAQEEKIAITDEEKDLILKFRSLSSEAKKGLLLFLK